MPSQDEIFHAGSDLVAAAESAPQSAGDIVREMFPFIWQASKKLSTRKISNWLETEKGISLSQATISRALKNPEIYWEELADKIEPSARVFSDWTSQDPLVFLFNRECFNQYERAIRGLGNLSRHDTEFEKVEEVTEALDFLLMHWFHHSEEIRDNCRRYVETDDLEELERRKRLDAEDYRDANQ